MKERTKAALLFIAILLTGYVTAQEVKVVDSENLHPIENVVIYNFDKSSSTLSNHNGVADLSDFKNSDTIIFQHATYQEFIIGIRDLDKLANIVKLRKKSVKLTEVVISASKWEQKKEEVPNKITTIDPLEVDYLNTQTSADLLGITNEVFIQKSQLGGGSPMIRGFSANSVLIVVDGVRMNNAIFRSGNLQNIINIDPNSIESAEVIFGPGSIIYGSDALGGVMDFHTRNVRLSADKKALLIANTMFRYSNAGNERTAHFDLNYGKKKWGFFSSISISDYDDLRMGSNHNEAFERHEFVERIDKKDSIVQNPDPNMQRFSGFSQLNIMQKIRYRPNDNVDLVYNLIYSTTSDIPRYDRLIQYKGDHLKYAQWYYGPQDWMMHNISLSIFKKTKLFDDAKFIAAYQEFQESRHDRIFQNDILRSRTEKVNVLSLNGDFDKALDKKQTLFYGLEVVHNNVNSSGVEENIISGETKPTASRYPDGGSKYSTFAVYGSYKNNINTKTTLTAGTRYSYISSTSTFNDTSFFNFPYNRIKISTGSLTGSLGLVYRPTQSWQFNISASSGYRAPNIDDVAKVFDSEPGNVIVPNDKLKPENSYNIDLGIIRNIGGIAKMDLTLFYTRLKNAMVRRESTFNGLDSIPYDGELSRVWSLVNVGSATIYGGSLSLNIDLTEHISFNSYLTWQKGEDIDGLPVRHVPPLFGSSNITLTRNKLRIMLYTNYNGEISYNNLAEPERNKPYLYASDKDGNPYSPAWWTFNIKTSYQINDHVRLDLGFENFFDYRYRPYSSGLAAPGRNIIIAIRGSI